MRDGITENIEKMNKLIADFDLFRRGHAGLRTLLIAKARIEGRTISNHELAIEVEKIRLHKEEERRLEEEQKSKDSE